MDDEEQVTVNEINSEVDQVINDEAVVEEESDDLRSDDVEGHEEDSVNSRLIPIPLTTHHLNTYERENHYLSSNVLIDTKDELQHVNKQSTNLT